MMTRQVTNHWPKDMGAAAGLFHVYGRHTLHSRTLATSITYCSRWDGGMECGLSVASTSPSHFPARSNYLSDYLLRMNAMRALYHPVLPSFASSTRSPTPCHRRLPTFSAAPRRRADRWIPAAAPEAMASTQPWTAQEQEKAKEAKLWGGRFEDSVTDAVERFSESVSFDKALYKQDIMGSRAHARMLAHQVSRHVFAIVGSP